MDDAATDSLLALSLALGFHTRGLGDLLRDGADPQALLAGEPALLEQLPHSTASAIAGASPVPARARRARAERLEACAARWLPITDPCYPSLLREIPDPPPWLYCRGDPGLLSSPLVAVVGSRRGSHAGLHLADLLARRLTELGYGVCSGLALGVDAAAHRGALPTGLTVAVFGNGIDQCYPKRHSALAGHIAAHGCLVSELPPGTAPQKIQFPRRNRIISGLSRATVIVEAALPSGTLHTASAALEQGRDLLVFPWSVLHPGGAGCLRLLRDGATPITSLEELQDHFPSLVPVAPAPAESDTPMDTNAGAAEKKLLTLIGDGRPTLNTLATAVGTGPAELLPVLGRLEVLGLVVREDGGYARARRTPGNSNSADSKSCQEGGS